MRRYLALPLSILALVRGTRAVEAGIGGEESAIALLAALRQSEGLPVLTPVPAANTLARSLASDMARSGRPWVFAPHGGSPWRRLGASQPDRRLCGVLTMQSRDGWAQIVTDWLSREDTRAILLDRKATRLGIGSVTDATGCRWVSAWLFA